MKGYSGQAAPFARKNVVVVQKPYVEWEAASPVCSFHNAA